MQSILQNSLQLLRHAATHRHHKEAIERATGEHYNVFKILGIGHYEVRTHSPMLGDLLNPKGTHSQGDTFLRLFVTQMGIADFDTASARLELEHYIGPVTDKSGGRIDIVISNNQGRTIFIENKIGAADQKDQLRRYRQRNAQADLFYLTLHGEMPSGFDEVSLEEVRATRMSYATDIRDWLMACRKESASLPHVRETISQYLHLVRELTGQSTTQSMNEELIKTITADEDSLGAYFTLTQETENVKAALVAKLDAQLDEAASAAGLLRDGRIENLHCKYSGIYFTTPALSRHNLRIGFCFDRRDFQDLDFGFAKKDKDPLFEFGEKLLPLFRDKFRAYSPHKPTEWWPAYADFEEPFGYWGNAAFQAIASGRMAASMKEKMVIMAEIAEEVCPD
jgi:hypothetical protein